MVAPAREEAWDGRIVFFLHTKLKYTISDYNGKEERWEGVFFFKLGNDKKVRCSSVIMRSLATKKEGM